MQDFDAYALAALTEQGITPAEGDLDVLRFVAAAFGPAIDALDAVDLRTLEPEPAPDPSRPPA